MAVPRYFRAVCGHAGCKEFAVYQADNRAHSAKLERDYGGGRWRCVRHAREEEVLSPSNRVRTHDIVSRQEDHGRYFGNSGFVYGPGFKVFAEDFPAGTRLRVTAEIILPDGIAATANEG